MKINDPNHLASLQKEFDQNRKKFNQKLYVSRYSESSRILKIIRVATVKRSIEATFQMLLAMLARDMNVNLTYNDLENDAYYKASSKDKKQIMHLVCFKEYEEVTLEWFTEDAWFSKNFRFVKKRNNHKTKIIYLEIVKGLRAKSSFLDQIMRNKYIKAKIIRFDMQMHELKHNLNLLSAKQLEKYPLKMSIFKEKLAKMRLFYK